VKTVSEEPFTATVAVFTVTAATAGGGLDGGVFVEFAVGLALPQPASITARARGGAPSSSLRWWFAAPAGQGSPCPGVEIPEMLLTKIVASMSRQVRSPPQAVGTEAAWPWFSYASALGRNGRES
jgi:hypothetical protein